MIRSATASSTRCREVFPSAGLWLRLPELELGFDLELEFALVLEPDLALLAAGDAVVMGRFSPSESVLNWSGAFPAGLGGTVMAQDARQGSQSRNAASLLGFRTIIRIGAIGRVYALLVRLRGLPGGVTAQGARLSPQSGNAASLRGFRTISTD